MGKFGNFFDHLVVRSTNFLQRERHERHALNWQRVVGKVTRYTTSPERPALPHIDYEYNFDSQPYTGSFSGYKIPDENVQRIGDLLEASPLLHIRVNPDSPSQSRVLNRDNDRFPFEIDHLEH